MMNQIDTTIRDIGGAPILPLPPVLDLAAADTLLSLLREKLATDSELRIDAARVETLTFPCAQLLVSALRSHREVSVEQPSDAFAGAFRDLGLDWMPDRSRGIVVAVAESPAAAESPEQVTLEQATPDTESSPSGSDMDGNTMPKRILTIDDSKTIRDMLMVTLSDAGFVVIQAVDGQDGIEVADKEQFDVVITDINMPRMDGYQVLRHLRNNPNYKNTPILVLTTESDAEKKTLARDAGATGWMVKPFDPDRLVATVCKVSP